MAPRMDDRRTPSPSIRETPRSVRPHSFTKLVSGNSAGLANHWKSHGKVFAFVKYPAADHSGFKILVIPA